MRAEPRADASSQMWKIVSACVFVPIHLRNGSTDLDEIWYECSTHSFMILLLVWFVNILQ